MGLSRKAYDPVLYATVILLANVAALGQEGKVNWNQFRGPNGRGAAPADRIPVRFGPATNVSWKTAVPAGHSSPVIWNKHVFLAASDPANGRGLITLAVGREEGGILWRRVVQAETPGRFHPLNNPASSTPAADEKHVYVYFGTYGLLFASAAALGGRGDDKWDAAATWKMTVAEFDRNHDNQIQRGEMTKGFAFIQRPELPKDNPGYGLPVKDMDTLLKIFDRDKNGVITEREWMETMSGFAAISHPTLVAIRPGATRDARRSHVAWEIQRGIPETPSLLYCRGKLYLLRDGGWLTCLEASTGRELFRERIGAPGQYIASPIVADDKVIAASVPGVVTVIQVDNELKVLARNNFGEQIFATPAVAGNKIYLRTENHLFALGERTMGSEHD